jgi:hypothetical protein
MMTLLHHHIASLAKTLYHTHTSPLMNNNVSEMGYAMAACTARQTQHKQHLPVPAVPTMLQNRRNYINLCAEHQMWLCCNTSAACEATCISTHPGLYCQAHQLTPNFLKAMKVHPGSSKTRNAP